MQMRLIPDEACGPYEQTPFRTERQRDLAAMMTAVRGKRYDAETLSDNAQWLRCYHGLVAHYEDRESSWSFEYRAKGRSIISRWGEMGKYARLLDGIKYGEALMVRWRGDGSSGRRLVPLGLRFPCDRNVEATDSVLLYTTIGVDARGIVGRWTLVEEHLDGMEEVVLLGDSPARYFTGLWDVSVEEWMAHPYEAYAFYQYAEKE